MEHIGMGTGGQHGNERTEARSCVRFRSREAAGKRDAT